MHNLRSKPIFWIYELFYLVPLTPRHHARFGHVGLILPIWATFARYEQVHGISGIFHHFGFLGLFFTIFVAIVDHFGAVLGLFQAIFVHFNSALVIDQFLDKFVCWSKAAHLS